MPHAVKWTDAEKAKIVKESLHPENKVTELAEKYKCHKSMIYAWRRQFTGSGKRKDNRLFEYVIPTKPVEPVESTFEQQLKLEDAFAIIREIVDNTRKEARAQILNDIKNNLEQL